MANIITCDARFSSALDWKKAHSSAISPIADGKKVLWFLDFGLFDQLQKPLDHPGQFANFALAIDHFQDTLWREFHQFSLGVLLYKASSEFSLPFNEASFSLWMEENEVEEHPWMPKLYLRTICVDYLEQLSRRLAEEIPAFVIFDPLPEDPLLRALLTDPEGYGRIKTNADWKVAEEKPQAVYMPAFIKPSHFGAYREILAHLEGEDYKLIPEHQLITSWHGLDTLYYHPPAISPSGHRKIQGFVAAGGHTIPFN